VSGYRCEVALIVCMCLAMGLTACGPGPAPLPTRGPLPTPLPQPTPLPPLPTLPPVGSEQNPLVMVLFASDGPAAPPDILRDQIASSEGITFDLQVAASSGEAYRMLCAGEAEVVLLDAFGSLAAQAAGCGEVYAIAERGGITATQGQFVTSVTRGILGVSAFFDQDFCRVDRQSLNTWIVPALRLRAAGIDPFTRLAGVVDTGDDDAVLRGVLDGTCDVGATMAGAEGDARGVEDIDRIRVIEVLPPVPNEGLVVVGHPDAGTDTLLRDLLRRYAGPLAAVVDAEGFVSPTGTEYDELQALLDSAGVDVSSMAE